MECDENISFVPMEISCFVKRIANDRTWRQFSLLLIGQFDHLQCCLNYSIG